jgi:hypothetical protein
MEKSALGIKESARVMYWFDLPERLHDSVGKSIGLVVLKSSEEVRASKRIKSGAGSAQVTAGLLMAWELAKESLRAVVDKDGVEKPLSTLNGTVDRWWEDAPPNARTMVANAYADITHVEEDEAEAFLQTRRAVV